MADVSGNIQAALGAAQSISEALTQKQRMRWQMALEKAKMQREQQRLGEERQFKKYLQQQQQKRFEAEMGQQKTQFEAEMAQREQLRKQEVLSNLARIGKVEDVEKYMAGDLAFPEFEPYPKITTRQGRQLTPQQKAIEAYRTKGWENISEGTKSILKNMGVNVITPQAGMMLMNLIPKGEKYDPLRREIQMDVNLGTSSPQQIKEKITSRLAELQEGEELEAESTKAGQSWPVKAAENIYGIGQSLIDWLIEDEEKGWPRRAWEDIIKSKEEMIGEELKKSKALK